MKPQKKILSLVLSGLLLSSIFIYSCQKVNPPLSQSTPGSASFQLSEIVSASVAGSILYEDGSPAKSLTVALGNATTTTNAEGEFVFERVEAPKNHAHIQVKAAGYFDGHKTIQLTENARSFTHIRLLKKESPTTFNAQTGGTINVTGGGRIIFEQNSIVNEISGEAYNGEVKVFSKWIDPASEVLDEITPGCLRGIGFTSNEENLTTYGMFAVELFDANNQPLQIKSGNEAELRFPIADALLSSAPEEMPSWSLDENIGLWREEGTLTKTGNEYAGTVSHFSFWNADLPGCIPFQVELRDLDNNLPMVNTRIKITRSNNLSRIGYTNSLGQAIGQAPSNENLTLEVIHMCGSTQTVLKTVNFSTANTSFNLGIVDVPNTGTYSAVVKGTIVDANNTPLANTCVTVKQAGSYGLPNVIKTDVQGQFTYSAPICTNSLDLEVVAYDGINKVHSAPSTFTVVAGTQNIGTITASGLQSEYIRATVTNFGVTQQHFLVEPEANFTCYFSNNGMVNFSSFSRIVGQNWYVSARSSGSQTAAGPNNLTYYYDKFDNTTTTGWKLNTPVDFSIKKMGAAKGDFVIASTSPKFLAPNVANNRTIFFQVKRDN